MSTQEALPDGPSIGAAPAVEESAARVCISSDGTRLGTIVGIHRDPATDAAKWAVLDGGARRRPRLFVPLKGAVPRRDGLHLPHDACQVESAPPVMDHTRMRLFEEIRLLEHYGLVATSLSSTGGHEAATGRCGDQPLTVTALDWRPYSRARLRRVVRTEEVTQVVTLRREELVIDEEPVGAVERLEAAFGLVERSRHEEVAIVLHREEVVLHRRVLPYERVRVSTVEVGAPWPPQRQGHDAPQLPPISL